jgi:hypothetical protein
MMSLLDGDTFSRIVMRWTVYPIPWTGEGVGPTCKTSSSLVVVMIGNVCRGKGSFSGHRYLMEDLSPSVPAYGILHIVNSFLPDGAYPMVASWCYLGVLPRHSNVGRQR